MGNDRLAYPKRIYGIEKQFSLCRSFHKQEMWEVFGTKKGSSLKKQEALIFLLASSKVKGYSLQQVWSVFSGEMTPPTRTGKQKFPQTVKNTGPRSCDSTNVPNVKEIPVFLGSLTIGNNEALKREWLDSVRMQTWQSSKTPVISDILHSILLSRHVMLPRL